MTNHKYRAVLQFVTAGNEIIKLRSDWVNHKDQVEDMVNSMKPFYNEKRTFSGYSIEHKEVVGKSL